MQRATHKQMWVTLKYMKMLNLHSQYEKLLLKLHWDAQLLIKQTSKNPQVLQHSV